MQNLLGDRVGIRGGKILGCHKCPMNGVPGVNKILGISRIHGRKVMLWAQSPGKTENSTGRELVGASGKFLWEALGSVGLTRDDVDIQNVMRCWPIDAKGVEHKPTPHELRCCSVYNEEALERNDSNAIVHLILGEVAGRQLLGDLYRKDHPIFWHKEWKAQVVIAPHPSYIIRSGGKSAGWIYNEFKDRMRAVKLSLEYPGEWGYLKAQNYGSVKTLEELDQLIAILRHEAKYDRRISVDIEDGTVDGKKVMLMIGFGWGRYINKNWKGGARSVILYHPQFKHQELVPEFVEKLRPLIGDSDVKKVFQHGSFDVPPIESFFGTKLRGYDFDTQYGAYLKNSGLRAYSLDAQANRSYPEFSGYKHMMDPYDGNYANAPLPVISMYNCADCDFTKRIEANTAPHVKGALVRIYIHDAFVLDSMEKRGPILDWDAHKRVNEVVPKLMKEVRHKLRQLAGKPDFNPGAPEQVAWLLFDKLKLKHPDGEGERGTKADVLEIIYNKTRHPAPSLVLRYRTLKVMKSTFLDGYAKSARDHDGQLRTIWWLTGAITGRLRSGKGDSGEKQGIVNFQNLHGNPLLQNILVSDANWRKALEYEC